MSPPTRRVRPVPAGLPRNAQPTSTNGSTQDTAIHEIGVFTEAIISTAVYGITGDLEPVEALEQVVRLGSRVEQFLGAVA